jgi:hypothetical protein
MFDMKAVSNEYSKKIQTVMVCYAPNHLHQKLHFNSANLTVFASNTLLVSTLSASILLSTRVFASVAIVSSKVIKQMNSQVHQAIVPMAYLSPLFFDKTG